MTEQSERVFLTAEQAIAMLPDGDTIHTFRSTGFALLGCDFRRDEVLAIIERGKCELAGDIATGMGHGLAINYGSWLFVETKK
jgi:hypothetical protein